MNQKIVTLKNASFKEWSSIPRAEKNLITLAIGITAISLLTNDIPTHTMMALLGLTVAKYFAYDKPKQDQAVGQYLKAVKGKSIEDWHSIQSIYKGRNVQDMGGFDAIENAVATRLFK